MDLERVQRWVMSTLAVTTGIHLAAGLVVAAAYVEASRVGARIGLLVVGAMFGGLSVAAGRAIHRKPPGSAWPLLGLAPAGVGAWLIL